MADDWTFMFHCMDDIIRMGCGVMPCVYTITQRITSRVIWPTSSASSRRNVTPVTEWGDVACTRKHDNLRPYPCRQSGLETLVEIIDVITFIFVCLPGKGSILKYSCSCEVIAWLWVFDLLQYRVLLNRYTVYLQ